jgi:hypothetical protein
MHMHNHPAPRTTALAADRVVAPAGGSGDRCQPSSPAFQRAMAWCWLTTLISRRRRPGRCIACSASIIPLTAEGCGIWRLAPDCSTRMSWAGRASGTASLRSLTIGKTSRQVPVFPHPVSPAAHRCGSLHPVPATMLRKQSVSLPSAARGTPGLAHRPVVRAAGAHAGLATPRHAVTKRSCHSGRDAGTKSARSADRRGGER